MVIVFLDANALIYLLEGADTLRARVKQHLRELAHAADGRLRIAMSALSRLECRIGPMKTGNQALLDQYDTFFAQPGLSMIQLAEDVVDLATAIRARYGLKTPDALQAACGLQCGNQHIFLSGDQTFTRVAGLNCHLIS